MADDDNEFQMFGPLPVSRGAAQAGLTIDRPDVQPEDADEFPMFGPQPVAPQQSTLGSAARGAVRSALPAAGGLAGAGAGAAGGAAIGEALFPPGGAIPGGVIGGIAGALGLGFGASYGVAKAQDYALSKAPDSFVEAIGQDDRQQRLDQEQHPYASFVGGLVPYALTMKPGGFAAAKLPENATALQRLMANPVTARILGGGLVGGMELAQESAEGNVDWNKVAISTAFGMVFNKPNRFGETIEGAIPNAFRRAPPIAPEVPREVAAFPRTPGAQEEDLAGYDFAPHPPTLNEADAFGVAGPGTTEATFLGSQARDPTTQATADANLREENATVGPLPSIDLERLARELHPEAFARYDELQSERDTFLRWIEDEPDNPVPRSHLASIEKDLATIGPEIGAARRRAAERSGVETIAPAPIAAEAEETTPTPAGSPERAEAVTTKPLAEQKASIAEDVKRQLIAAARPDAEAEDIGTLVANRFAVRAGQFKGALGTAEELYRREGARFEGVAAPAAASPAEAPRAETVAERVAPEEARAKADSLEVTNLVDALLGAGATPKEIETVIGKKMTADEIAAMAPTIAPTVVESPRVKGPAELEYERIKAENAAKPLPPRSAAFEGMHTGEVIPVENLPERLARMKAEKEAGVSLRQGVQGSYTPEGTRGVIRLFEGEANASTAIHELGHDFLEQMRRDAAHGQAPLQTRADWATVKQALRIADDKARIKTPAHEQFARWFEQYLHEGVAPSRELAGVFARFKNWLANVYKTVADIFDKRQVPMSADVRAVFGRMLADDPVSTVISPEATRPTSIADAHAIEAERIPPPDAAPAAERIASERVEVIPPKRIEHEIAPVIETVQAEAEARATGTQPGGKVVGGVGGLPEVERGGVQSGAEPASGGVGGGSGEKRAGGNEPTAESGGVPSGPAAAGGRSEPGGAVGGQPLAPGPNELLTPPKRFVDKAGNIRLDNVNGVEDLKALAREIAASNNDFIGNRRAPLSDRDVMALQAVIGDDRVTRKTLGEASNAEEGLAIQRIAAQAWREMANAASTFKQSRSDADLMVYIERQQRATMMQAYYSQATAEAGRALRAMRKVQEFWSAGAEGAKGVTEGAPKPKPGDIISQATGRTLFQKAQEALLVASYEDPQAVARFNNWTRRHSFGRMVLEYWINGLLSGTATHTTYVIGNTLLSLERGLLETPVAATLGALRPVMGRETGNVVRFGEAAARWRGFTSGYFGAVQASAEAFRSGIAGRLPGEETGRRLPFQVEGAPPLPGAMLNEHATAADAKAAIYGASRGILDGLVSMGKILQAAPEGQSRIGAEWSALGANPDVRIGAGVVPIGQVIRAPSRVIASIHTFFRAMNYSIEKHAEIYRQAASEAEMRGWTEDQRLARMADLTNNTPEDIVSRAAPIASEMTLMQPAGEFMRKLQALTNWAPDVPIPVWAKRTPEGWRPVTMGETPLLKFVDPFVQISASIIDQTFVKRTPLGYLSVELRRDLLGHNGPAAQDMAQARMIVGTTMALGFGALAARGYVTGSGPSDRNKAAVWRLAGNQPHSIRIGDTWYQMNRLGPLGMLLGASADLYDVAHTASQGDMLGGAAALQHAITQNVLDESFMRGPSELIQALDDPGRYGERYIRNFASSFVPMSVGMAQLDRATDPYSRQARTVIDAIRQKVPSLSESLLPKRDIWGEPIPNQEALLASGVTAIYESRMSRDPVNLSLAEMGIGIAPVGRTIANVKLTDQQYDDYARLAGRLLKQRLDLYVRSPDWRQWTVQQRVDMVNSLKEQNRTVARGMIMMKYPSIMAQSTRTQRARAAR